MGLQFYYSDRRNNWPGVDIGGSIRTGEWALSMSAQLGEIAQSSITFDDVSGNLGHAGDQIKGLKNFYVFEDEAPTNNQLIYAGYIQDRNYESGMSLITGESVQITADLADLNDEAHYYLIPGDDAASGDRPAETVGARLTWLIASTYINLVDSGLVVYPTTTMDAHNYANQTGADVLDDCAQATGYNWFIYIHEADSTASLFFDNPNTSTAYTSSLRISNVLADKDSDLVLGDGATHTWNPSSRPKLTRSPKTVAALERFGWSKGTVSVSRSATADEFGRIDNFTADSNVTSAAEATRRANRILRESASEEDTIEVQIQVPRANVNDVREGQRMQAKFRQLPGYKDWSWFRVLKRTVASADVAAEFYTLTLTLSPQASGGAAIVQKAAKRHPNDLTFAANTTPGNLLIHMQTWRQLATASQPSSDGETWTQVGVDEFFHRTGSPDAVNAVAIWATVATISQATHPEAVASGGAFNGTCINSVMYELSGVTLSDIGTPIGIANQPLATSLAIGSLGTVFTGQIALGLWSNGFDGFSNQATTHAAEWVRDFMACRDEDETSTSFFSSTATVDTMYGEGFPFSWYGHQLGADAAVSATTTIDASQKWGGIAVVVG